MTGRAKWDAWNTAGKKYTDGRGAEARYLEIAKGLGWNEADAWPDKREANKGKGKSPEGEDGDVWDSDDENTKSGGGGLGPSVSTMAHSKEASEQTLHGFAVENNVKGIEDLLALVPDLNLNELDEHVSMTHIAVISNGCQVTKLAKGYTPLHLAADRGHLDIVKLLLSKGVEVSIKVCVIPVRRAHQN